MAKLTIPLGEDFISEVEKDESSYSFHPLKVSFDPALVKEKQVVRVSLTNGKTKIIDLLPRTRMSCDLQAITGYPEKVLLALDPRHSIPILKDLVRDSVLGVFKKEVLVGIKATQTPPCADKNLSRALKNLFKIDPNFKVRAHDWTEGDRKIFLVHDREFTVCPNDPWQYGFSIERDEIVDTRARFQQFAFRVICSNGLIGKVLKLGNISKRKTQEVFATFDIFNDSIKRLLQLPVEPAPQRLKLLMTLKGFDGNWDKVPVEHDSVYGIVNAITKEAQGRPDRLDLEALAGDIVSSVVLPKRNPIKEALFEAVV